MKKLLRVLVFTAAAMAIGACGKSTTDAPVARAERTGIYDTWGPLFEKETRDGANWIKASLYLRIEKDQLTAISLCEALVSGKRYEVEAVGTTPAKIDAKTIEIPDDVVLKATAPSKLNCEGTLKKGTLRYEVLPGDKMRFERDGESTVVGRRR